MKRILILSILMLLVAASVYANSGRAVMPYWWNCAGAYKATPIVFCAHYPLGIAGTADVTLTWYETGSSAGTPMVKFFSGAGHQRFDYSGSGVLGFATVDWTSYDGGFVGCTGILWYGSLGSLYHIPFVE